MNSKHHGKCEFALNLIQFSTVSNLCPLEVVQIYICQCCQLCVLWENSNTFADESFAKSYGPCEIRRRNLQSHSRGNR